MKDGWNRVGPYAIGCGSWMIAKAFVDGATLYTLSSNENGGTRYGTFESAEDAKKYAAQLELGAQA